MTAWQALGLGLGLGLGAGITPGPLLGLIIRETLHGGWRAGVLVACAPPLADLAVIALCFLLLARMPGNALPLLAIGGGCYLLFLAWETLRTTPPPQPVIEKGAFAHRRSLGKGLLVNLLNPHPYVFWLTVAGPLVLQWRQQQAFGAILAFVYGFYSCLVGAKLVLALLVHSGRTRLQGRGYQLVLQASGVFFLVFALLLLWSGIQQF